MKTFKQMLVPALFTSVIIFSACHKDKADNNIVSRNGLVFSGDQEVPVRATSATGTANVSYDKTTKVLSFTLNWSGLTTPATVSHIHGSAARGVGAGVKFDYSTLIPKTVSGTLTHSAVVDGVAIKEDSLLNGFYYFNIHTSTWPGGEIRAQIEF